MSNEYRIIPPPEMARLMYEGKTLEFEIGGEGYWEEGEGFSYKSLSGGEEEPITGAWTAYCRIKQEPKRESTLMSNLRERLEELKQKYHYSECPHHLLALATEAIEQAELWQEAEKQCANHNWKLAEELHFLKTEIEQRSHGDQT